MKEFVDLLGASGSSYRFRLLEKGTTPLRMAGNYAVVKTRGVGMTVVRVGVTTDLSKVREETADLTGRGLMLYIRLNVARSTREADHADLTAIHGGETQLAAE